MESRSDYLKRFGKHLQRFRKGKGLSLRELELRGEVSRQFLSDVELGKTNLTLYSLKKISDAFEVPLEEIMKDFKR
jgi:transcriptional regulator with XRE-family HTH domain